jgi:hypothetical protein
MHNQTLKRVLNAVPFRDAGKLHNQLREGQGHVSTETRKMVRSALRAAGLVASKTA